MSQSNNFKPAKKNDKPVKNLISQKLGKSGNSPQIEKTPLALDMLKPSTRKKFLNWMSAIILSLTLGIISIWNVLDKMKTHYVGEGELEGWLWRYWWMKKLLSSLWAQTPKDWSAIIYTYLCAGNYPETGNVFDLQTFSLILEPIFGDPAYYNIKIALILFLNGIAGYALCKYLTKSPIISLMGAAVLALNPYVLSEISSGRPRQAMLFTMPLFAMYLFENYRTLSLKSALWAGFWLGLTAAVYLYYGMAALFFGLIFLIYHLIFDRKNFTATFAKYVMVMLVIFVLVSGPFSFRYIEIVMMGKELPEVTYGRDFPPLDFLFKDFSQLDPRDELSHSIMRYRYSSQPVDFPFLLRYNVNLPLVVTLLILIPMFFVKPVPWFWIITLFFFYFLSLGPYLKVGSGHENYVRIFEGRGVPLPYVVFFKYVPFFARLFAPLRLLGMFYVSAVALVVINTKYVIGKIREKFSGLGKVEVNLIKSAFVVLFISLMVLQMFSSRQLPIPLTKIVVPEVYKNLREYPGKFGIIQVPFRTGDFVNYYQIYHKKRLLWGWASGSVPNNFPPSEALYLALPNFKHDNSFIRYLEELNTKPEDPPDFKDEDLKRLKYNGYRFVVLHERGCFILDEHEGDKIYDYFLNELSEHLGKPVMTGNEPANQGSKLTPGRVSSYRIAVFEI